MASTPLVKDWSEPHSRGHARAAQPAWRDIAALAKGPLAQSWDALDTEASEPNPFFERWFLCPSLANFDPAGQVRLFAPIEGAKPYGLAPMLRSSRYYGKPIAHHRLWLHANAFCATPLIATGREHDFWLTLLAELDANPRGALFLHLPLLDADGPVLQALDEILAAQRRPFADVMHESRAALSSSLSSNDYLHNALTTKKRKELRRQSRRLGELGALSFERRDDASGIEEWIEAFLALEKAGWKGANGSALADDEATRRFFAEALEGAAQSGRLERLALRLDGRAIAMLANFITPPGSFAFKTCFDEQLARFSPGVLLQLENLALLDNDKVEWCDSCALPGHPMIEHIWREKRRMVRRNVAIGGRLRRSLFKQMMRFETRKRHVK